MINPTNDDFAFHPTPECDAVAPLLLLRFSNEITPDDRKRVDAHLKSCEQCRRQDQQLGELITESQRLLTPFLSASEGESEEVMHVPPFQDILRAADALQPAVNVEQASEDDTQAAHDDAASEDPLDKEDTQNARRLILLGQPVAGSPSPRSTVATRRLLALQTHGSLALTDSPDMHADRDYSVSAAACLSQSYWLGSRGQYGGAIQLLLPLVKLPIAQSQAIRVYYYLGLWLAALGDYSTSTEYLDEAVTRVIRNDTIDNMFAAAQIGHALGENHYHTLQCASATEYYTLALDALDMTADEADADVASDGWDLRITAMLRLASQYFLLSRFDEAMRALSAARTLLVNNPETPQSPFHRATFTWISALLSRWIDDPAAGIRNILETLAEYSRHDSPLNNARAHIVASDIILDLAERHGVASVSASAIAPFIRLAEPYILRALQQTHALGDMSGEFMAGLTHIRLLRVTNNQDFDRCAILDSLILQAKHVHEPSLLGQAYTALGDELLHRNAPEQAGNCYRYALDALADTEIPAYGVFARRALLRLSEGLLVQRPESDV